MQFHLQGFRPGDSHLTEACPSDAAHTDAVPVQVDVPIVGCSPAGLPLDAHQALAAFFGGFMLPN